MIRAVVFDLDGVLRHFPSALSDQVEQRHGLEVGSIAATAFSQPLLTDVTTGLISRQEWITRIGLQVGSRQAAHEWGELVPEPDPLMLHLADELRSRGLKVALLTNGTDTIPQELDAQGIASHVDEVFNSATIGFIKPDRRIFQYVLDALNRIGPEVFFADDSPSKLAGAKELGFLTHHFRGIESLREALILAGVN